MSRTISLLAASVALLFSSLPATAVTIDTVPVGNPGNANDATGVGAVSYPYRIGTYEVTAGQYATFLNAVAATDTYGLYNPNMATEPHIAGISRAGAPGTYSYGVIGSPNKPVTFVDWGDAARFANWLQNGQPSGLQNASTTESGAYTLNGATSSPALQQVNRNSSATWFIPSNSEWYKAAYHKNDGVTSNYFDYPTSSDTAPTAETPPGGSNSANYMSVVGDLTDVGAYTASTSPYGTFDQAGNAWEWTEARLDSSYRGIRGGSWNENSLVMVSSNMGEALPSAGFNNVGFRVATIVPEPSTLALGLVGAFGAYFLARRRHAN